jgi:hypothetical protein
MVASLSSLYSEKKIPQLCYSGTRLTNCQTHCFLVCLFSTLLLRTTQVLFESIKRPFFQMSFTHFMEVAREGILSRNERPPFQTTMIIVGGRGRPIRGDPRS